MTKTLISLKIFFTIILAGCARLEPSEYKQCAFIAEEEKFICSFLSTGKVFYIGGMKYIDNIYYKDGFGVEYFSDGAIYKGGWKMGKKSGQGIYTVPDQTSCSSDWIDDRQTGTVTCIYSGETDGHIREGLTNGLGEWIGITFYTFPDGKKVEEFWENGGLIYQREIIAQ